jgi:hypothetical protein
MADESAKIDAWRRQMQEEEEAEYAAEQAADERRAIASLGREEKKSRASASTDGLPGGGTVRFKPQQEERTITPRKTKARHAEPQAQRPEPDYSVAGMVPTRSGAGDGGNGAPPPAMKPAPGPAPAASSFDWNANTMQQLQEFQGQNAGLQAQLKAKERELERYKRDVEMNNLTGGITESPKASGSSLDPRDAKIVELAKKNRAMSLVVQREKDNASRLAGELKRTNQAMQQVQANPEAMRMGTQMPKGTKAEPWSLAKGEEAEEPDRKEEMKALKDRLRDANHRLNTQTVQVGTLKQELASVKRALTKEVGEGVDLKAIVEEGGGWKGRAQQISLLKDKLRESKRALEATRHTAQSGAPTMTMAEMQAQSAASEALAADRGYALDEKNRKHLSEIGRDRRRETEELEANVTQLQEQNAALKKKNDGASARVKNLEKDMKAMKGKVLLVLEKSNTDDKLIAALKEQVRTGGGGGGGGGGAGGKPVKMTAPLKQKEQQIDRQEKIILALRAELNTAQQRVEEVSRSASRSTEGDVEAMRALHIEAEKMTELNSVMQQQLEQERNARAQVEKQLREAEMRAEMGVRAEPAPNRPTADQGPPAEATAAAPDRASLAEYRYRVTSLEEQLQSSRRELSTKGEEIMLLQQTVQQQQEMMEQQLQLVAHQQEKINSPAAAGAGSLAHGGGQPGGATTPRRDAAYGQFDDGGGGDGYGESGDEGGAGGMDHLMSTNERLRDELSGLREQVQQAGGGD